MNGLVAVVDRGNDSDIVIAGRGGQTIATLVTIGGTKGIGDLSFGAATSTDVGVIWSPVLGQEDAWRWSLYWWNRARGSAIKIRDNPTDAKGSALPGGYVKPFLTSDSMYWQESSTESHRGWHGVNLMRLDLKTGKVQVLYRGVVTAFVVYGDIVVMEDLDPRSKSFEESSEMGRPPFQRMVAIDRLRGTGAPVPAGLDFANHFPDFVATNGRDIVWTKDLGLWRWDPVTHRSRAAYMPPQVYRPPGQQKYEINGFGYVHLYKNFVTFNGGGVSLYDLDADAFASLQIPGVGHVNVDASGSMLGLTYSMDDAKVNRDTGYGLRGATVIDMAGLPGLTPCRK